MGRSLICASLALTIASLSFVSSATAQTSTPPAAAAPAAPAAQAAPGPPAKPADVASMDAILASLYDVISGPAGQKRDWDRFRSLFTPGARLIPTRKSPQDGKSTIRVTDPDGYISRSSAALEKGFFEKEVSRKVDTFGGITHVFSTYESRHAADEAKPFARGINSIQLYNDGTRWWIVTVYWQAEREDSPIPSQYLTK